jgi:hypothetical protein
MIFKLHTVILLLAMYGLSLVHANCNLKNAIEDDDRRVEDRKELCMGQGEGAWTFSLHISMVSVPTLNGQVAYSGVAGSNVFIIYDNACNRMGVYDPHDDADCGVPYSISEPWLPYDIIVKKVNLNVGGGHFRFSYGAGDYMIGENHAECNEMSEGLRAEEGCKTAFPLNGDGSN